MRFSKILKPVLSFVVMLVLSIAAFAQSSVITGSVTDNANSKALESVTVSVKGTAIRTSTDAKGQFTIAAAPTATLVFSYVGYTPQEVKVGTGKNFDIHLIANTNTMDEVVVVGYGTRKRVNVQGAVSTIKAAEIEDLPVANLPSSLVNRVPGVSVNFSSGKPGSTTTLNLRNSTTATASFPGGAGGVSSQPLIVIDGIISNPAQWSQSPNADFLDNLDASQIEDITFLKDASAAIYGAAGAKGVVLITTKRGKAGKPKMSYSGYFGQSTPTVNPKTLTAYEHAKFLNDGFELTGSALNTRFSQADLDSLRGLEDKSWFDYFWKDGKVQRHTVNVSGGTDRVTFFAGGSYYNEKGNYGIISTDKYNLRAGMNAKIIDGLTADVTFATDYNQEESNNHSSASTETDDATIRPLYLTPKWVPVTIGDKLVGFQGANNTSPQNQNWSFLGVQRSGSYRDSRSQGLAVNASMEWKPKFLSGLSARVQFGKNNRSAIAKGYFAAYNVANFQRRGQNSLLYSDQLVVGAAPTVRIPNNDQIQEGTTISDSYQFFGTLSYGKKIGAHEFDVMVGFDQSESEGRNVLLAKNTQIVAGVDEFWAFSNDPTALGSINEVVRPTQAFITAKRSYITRSSYLIFPGAGSRSLHSQYCF